jgi:hypothetical protein
MCNNGRLKFGNTEGNIQMHLTMAIRRRHRFLFNIIKHIFYRLLRNAVYHCVISFVENAFETSNDKQCETFSLK